MRDYLFHLSTLFKDQDPILYMERYLPVGYLPSHNPITAKTAELECQEEVLVEALLLLCLRH